MEDSYSIDRPYHRWALGPKDLSTSFLFVFQALSPSHLSACWHLVPFSGFWVWFDLSPYFFSDCLSPCLISNLYPTVLNAVKEKNCGRNVYLNPNVLICFCCARFMLCSVSFLRSATTSYTVSERNIFVFVTPNPLFLFSKLNKFMDVSNACVSIQSSIFSMSVLKFWA